MLDKNADASGACVLIRSRRVLPLRLLLLQGLRVRGLDHSLHTPQ